MDTKDLRYFCRVYEERGINKAAKQLFITPQGLSRIIQNLEEEFQTPLFERTSQGMIPTECGTYLYNHSQSLINQIEDITMGMKKLKEKECYFEIGFSCGVLNLFPFDKLEIIKKSYPNMHIFWNEAENSEILERVYRNQIDIAFVIGKISNQELMVKEVFQKNLDVLVYEGHPLYIKDQLSVKDLQGQPLITLNEKFDSYHSLVQRCQDFGFTPSIVLKTMESQLIYRFCKEKIGLGIDVNIHQNYIIENGLKRIELYDSIPWKISCIVKKERIHEDIVQAMFELF